MKRIFTLALVAVMTMSGLSLNAQNKFKGIVKYQLSSVGSTPVEIKPEQSTLEVKVLGDKLMVGENQLQNGRSIYTFMDLSGLLGYLGSQDITLETDLGNGKIYTKQTLEQKDIDSLTIPCTEGFYIEYVADGSKKVAGIDCPKAIIHIFGEDGTDKPIEVWYAPEIGPEVSMVPFGTGTKGLPMEFQQGDNEGRMIKYVATEVVKGKVKDVDFLMPSGYKEMTDEQMKAFSEEMDEIQEMLGE